MVSRADVRERPLGLLASGSSKRSFLVLWLISSVLSKRKVWKPKLLKMGLSDWVLRLLRRYQAYAPMPATAAANATWVPMTFARCVARKKGRKEVPGGISDAQDGIAGLLV
jgi:hypothetical protein